MARDYTRYAGRQQGVYLSRRTLMFLAFAVLLFIGFQIFRQPTWLVQRLDSPDGARTAVLKRTQYFEHYFKVQARSGGYWRTIYNSPAITNSYAVDLRERLYWNEDSTRLYFTIQGHIISGYDFEERRALSLSEMQEAQAKLGNRFAR